MEQLLPGTGRFLFCTRRMEQLLPGTGRFLFCTRLDDDTYPNAIQVSDQQLAAVQLTGDAFHPESNSTINPSVINA